MRKGRDDFRSDGFADLAVAVVDAALRQRESAATGAGLRVEFVKRDDFLLGRQFGEIHAGQFAGALGVLQENLSLVLESFHFDVAVPKANNPPNSPFIE